MKMPFNVDRWQVECVGEQHRLWRQAVDRNISFLVGEEAARREKRRERNREAARKLKEKRQLIEEELNEKLKTLENQHTDLEGYLQHLKQRKQCLQNEVNNTMNDPIHQLLANENPSLLLFFEQYADDMDLFDQSIERLLNSDFDCTA